MRHDCTCECCGAKFDHHTDDAHICNPCGTLSKRGCQRCKNNEAASKLGAITVAPGFYAYQSPGNPATGDKPRWYVLDTAELAEVEERIAKHDDLGGAEMPIWWEPTRPFALMDGKHVVKTYRGDWDTIRKLAASKDYYRFVTADLTSGEEVPA